MAKFGYGNVVLGPNGNLYVCCTSQHEERTHLIPFKYSNSMTSPPKQDVFREEEHWDNDEGIWVTERPLIMHGVDSYELVANTIQEYLSQCVERILNPWQAS